MPGQQKSNNVQNKRELQYVTKGINFAERRKTARLEVPIQVYYKIIKGAKGFQKAVTKNVSAAGCLLLTTDNIVLDSEVELQVFLGKSGAESLNLRGTIVRLNRKQRGLYEFGISFQALSAQSRRVFAEYFFSKIYEMMGLAAQP